MGERHAHLALVACPGGTLKLYHDSANDSYSVVATCDCGHGVCQKRRTLEPSKPGGKRAQGRPLALLVAWLRQGVDRRDIVNARHHKFGILVTHEDRKKARQALKEFDGIDAFLEKERDPWSEEEGSEPEGEP